jgi:two-component system nitrogen regulation response regulator GlnG/two-component system response regulator HydG
MEKPTLPDETDVRPRGAAGAPDVLALVVGWCPQEPGRVGEVLVLPPGDPGPLRSFGRGGAQPGDPHPRLQLVRDRPWGPEVTPPLAIERLSRVQLHLRARGQDCVELQNDGRPKLRHDGRVVEEAVLRPGETIEIGKQLLLLCVRRKAWLSGERTMASTGHFGRADETGIVGESQAIWDLRKTLTFAAMQQGHVLILGASGTGKELAARAIHALSQRARGPFVARSAATLPEGIIDAELFGNAKNYPNPGVPDRPGLIGQASGGTLLLDEFAELSPALQAHLLRVLDGGEYHRLGESAVRVANIRLIVATNRDESALKHDLLARLRFRIRLPDLNARREDIPLIARHLLVGFAAENPDVAARFVGDDGEPRFSVELIRSLLTHEYKAHVRELERLLWRSIEKSPADTLMVASAEEPGGPSAEENGADDDGDGLTATRIQACLDEHNGALEPSWRALGLKNRHALSRLIVKHGLEVRRKPGRRS